MRRRPPTARRWRWRWGSSRRGAAVARAQSQGVRRRVATDGWVVAGFAHRTSREGDPQLHTHCLVPNLVRRARDGRHVAIDGGPLFEWARAAGSVYQNHLQRTLSERLGVCWRPDRNNTREMEGFTRAQLRAFSKRSAQIEAELEIKGALYESPALRMQADDEASLATRTAKDHSLTPSLLAGRWQQEADQVGLAVGADLDQAVSRASQLLDRPGWEEITVVLVDPEEGLCSRSARFTKTDVVEHICAISGGRLSTEEIAVMADRFVDSDLAVRLTPDVEAAHRKPAQWSTAAHRALEDRTLALMDTLASRAAPVVAKAAVDAVLIDSAGARRRPDGRGAHARRRRWQPAGRVIAGGLWQDDHAAYRRPGRRRRWTAGGGGGHHCQSRSRAGRRRPGRPYDRPAPYRSGGWAAGGGDGVGAGRDLPDPHRRGRGGPGCGGRLPRRAGLGVGRPAPVPAGRAWRCRRPPRGARRRRRDPGRAV